MLSLPLDMEPRTQDGSRVAVRWFPLCALTASIEGQRSGISRKTGLGAVPVQHKCSAHHIETLLNLSW